MKEYSKVNIYTLSCPISGLVRYVGKTVQDLEKRLRCHMSSCLHEKSHRTNWLVNLRKQGLLPIIELLEECQIDDWVRHEIYWISQFKEWGFPLVNGTKGGEGTHGRVLSEETKLKISESLKGKKQTKEVIEKRVSKFRGRKHTEEHRKKMVETRRRNLNTPENIRIAQEKLEKKRLDGIERRRLANQSRSEKAKQAVAQYDSKGELIEVYQSVIEGSLKSGVSVATISNQINGKGRNKSRSFWKKLDTNQNLV